jgi:hypothetical protein
MSNNPVMRVDPTGMLDHKWTVNVETGERTYVDNSGGDEAQIVEYINNEGHHLGVQIIDGENFYHGSASDGYFASKYDLWGDIPNGYNALSGYEYNSKDLQIRYWVTNDHRSYRGFQVALRNNENEGKSEPVSAESYWSHYGHTVGQNYLGKLYLNSAFDMEGHHGAAGAGTPLRTPKGYNPAPVAPAPERHTNFTDILKTRAGKDVGKYHNGGN